MTRIETTSKSTLNPMPRSCMPEAWRVAAVSLLLVACGASGETPTPEVTPTPTATAVPSQSIDYRVTAFTVAGTNENGDPTAIQAALDAMADAAYTAIYEAVCSDTPTVAPCLPNLEETLSQIFSVDTISNAINTPIESGDVNYFMQVGGVGNTLTLTWSTGSFDGTGFAIDDSLASLTGTLEADSSSTFGPTDVPLTVVFNDPVSGDVVVESTLTLYQSSLALEHLFEPNLNGLITARVKPDELTALLVAVVEALVPSDEPLPGTVEDSVLEALQPYLDADLDNDGTNDALSILVYLQGDEVAIVE